MGFEGSDATDSSRPTPETTHEGWEHHAVTRDLATGEDTSTDEPVSLAYYRRRGAGPPLVCVHGLTAWGPDLFEVAFAVGDDECDIVVADIRGHGRSGAPESGYDLATAATDLRAVIEHAGVKRPVLLGHSLGGGIVTTYAARYPARAVVAVDPVGLLDSGGNADDADETDDADRTGDADDGSDWITESITASRQALRRDDMEATAPGAAYAHHRVRRFGAGATADPTDRYARIDAPVLVLRADVSAVEREADADRLAALADSRVAYVEDASHVVHRDRPERTVSLVKSFLSE